MMIFGIQVPRQNHVVMVLIHKGICFKTIFDPPSITCISIFRRKAFKVFGTETMILQNRADSVKLELLPAAAPTDWVVASSHTFQPKVFSLEIPCGNCDSTNLHRCVSSLVFGPHPVIDLRLPQIKNGGLLTASNYGFLRHRYGCVVTGHSPKLMGQNINSRLTHVTRSPHQDLERDICAIPICIVGHFNDKSSLLTQ